MKKKIGTLLSLMMLSLSTTMTAYATGADGGEGSGSAADPFRVTFTGDQKLVSTFGTSDVNSQISGLMPGDTAAFSVTLENGDSGETQWYMKNSIIKSMEEMSENGGASGATGGAYSYRLTYIPSEGDPVVLFDSTALGGDGDLGLHGADEALEDHLYLGDLMAGEEGTVLLEVGLDGETQDNSYMIKTANLSMNFAVIPQLQGGPGSDTHRTVRREVVNDQVVYLDENGDLIPLDDLAARIKNAGLVKTGDGAALSVWTVAACGSGILLMAYGLFAAGRRKKGAEGGGER